MRTLFTVKEFAKEVGIHEQTVYEKIRMKEIECRRVGRSIKIPLSELLKYNPCYEGVKTPRETELEKENVELKMELEKYKDLVKNINLSLLRLNA